MTSVSAMAKAQPATRGIFGMRILIAMAVPITLRSVKGVCPGLRSEAYLPNIGANYGGFSHEPEANVKPAGKIGSIALRKIHPCDRSQFD